MSNASILPPYPTCETIPELCVCNQYPVRKLIVVNGRVEVLFLYKGVSKQIIPKI